MGRFEISRAQQAAWRAGELHKSWFAHYPELFDEDDLRLVESQGHSGHHFVEWLGAIFLYRATGYLSLVSKYEFRKHARKTTILEQLAPSEVLALIRARGEFGRTQCPDLLVYSPNMDDWFFCEVKGPGDRFSTKQRGYFEELARVSGKDIALLSLRWRSKG